MLSPGEIFMKGQVSTEYLVILAIVLVVALIVVYLVGGFAGIGTGTVETASKNYWAGASPFSIKTVKVSGSEMDLEVQNNDLEKLTITDISIDNDSVFSASTELESGENTVLDATVGTSCGDTGERFTYEDVVITYSKGEIDDLKQVGAKPLVGTCS
jgi:uncharacterized protein (UPF0333 family)